MSLFKASVWMAVPIKGKKINYQAYLEQLKLLIELNSQELTKYTTYLIGLLSIVVPLYASFYALSLSIEWFVGLFILNLFAVLRLLIRMYNVNRVNRELIEAYCNIQSKRAGYRLIQMEGNLKEMKELIKEAREEYGLEI